MASVRWWDDFALACRSPLISRWLFMEPSKLTSVSPSGVAARFTMAFSLSVRKVLMELLEDMCIVLP